VFVRTPTGFYFLATIAVGAVTSVPLVVMADVERKTVLIAAVYIPVRAILESRPIALFRARHMNRDRVLTTAWSMTEMVTVPLIAVVPAGVAFVAVAVASSLADRLVSPRSSMNPRPLRTLIETAGSFALALDAVVARH